MNAETQHKIRDLTLSENQWTWLWLFNNILQVSYVFSLVIYSFHHQPSSMLMKLSMLSWLHPTPLCTTPSLPLKNCTLNGKRHWQNFATNLSRMHSKLPWRSLTNTTRERPHQMHILLRYFPCSPLFPCLSSFPLSVFACPSHHLPSHSTLFTITCRCDIPPISTLISDRLTHCVYLLISITLYDIPTRYGMTVPGLFCI